MGTTYLDVDDISWNISNNGTTVYGQTGTEQIVIDAGVTGVVTDQNVERVDMAGAAADFTYLQQGNQLLIYTGGVLTATVPLQIDTDGTQLVFSDGSVEAVLDAGVMTLGGATVDATTAGAVVPTTIDTGTVSEAPEAPPEVAASLSIADVTVAEDGANATFTVTLSTAPGTGETVTVDYATADGTAIAGTDYTAATGTLTFAEGVTTQTITVPIIDDTVIGTTDAFTVNLSGVTGTIGTTAATISDASATGTITENDVAVAGETYEMTTSSDLVIGTDGDDTINGLVGTIEATGALNDTFQSVDIVDGGAGTDTINISLATQTTPGPGATVTNVENVKFTDYDGVDLNMTNMSGVSSFTNIGSISDTGITGVSEIFDITVQNVNGYETKMTYTGTTLAGVSDSVNITLNKATNDANVTLTDAANDYETINVTSSGGANRVDLGGTALDAATTLNISGDQALNIDDTDNTNAMAALKTVNASTFTGNLTASLINQATDLTVTGGAGDDKVTITSFDKEDAVDLGAGNDTLVIAATASVTTAASLANIENLTFTTDGNYTVNLSGATELEAINLVAVGANTMSFTKAVATCDTVNFNALGVTADTTLDGITFALATGTGTSDALTVNFSNVNANGVAIDPGKGTQIDVTSFTANTIETLVVNTSSLGVDTNATTQDGGILFSLTSTDTLRTLTVVSDTFVDMDGVALDATVNAVDASQASNGIKLDMSLAEDDSTTTFTSTSLSVTTGAGNDTITTLNADVRTSTVSLGAGDDSLTMVADDFGSGNTSTVDTLTIDAGAGKDTIDVSASTSLVDEATIAVTLGDGVDTIKIKGTSAAQTGISVTDFVVGSGGDKIDLATNASAQFGSTVGYVETAGAATLDNGMTVYTGNDAASLVVADVATALAAATLIDANTAGDKGYIVASDGTDTGVYEFIDAAGSTAIAAGELVLILTLTGVTDASLLVVDNFTDFLA